MTPLAHRALREMRRERLRANLLVAAGIALFLLAVAGEWMLLSATTPADGAEDRRRVMWPLCNVRELAVADSFFAIVPGECDTLYVAYVAKDSTVRLCYPEPLWPMPMRMHMNTRGPLDSMSFFRGNRYIRNPRFCVGCDYMSPWRAFPSNGGKP